MSNETMTVKGELLFYIDDDEITYKTRNFEEWEEHRINIPVYDLISGIDFVDSVEDGCFIDEDGSIAHVIVDGYVSNVGISSDHFTQGGFLFELADFRKLCTEFDIQVNWANK